MCFFAGLFLEFFFFLNNFFFKFEMVNSLHNLKEKKNIRKCILSFHSISVIIKTVLTSLLVRFQYGRSPYDITSHITTP